ncbi:hypothetical protein BO82DRAFT_357699 [Aspergillus uvarum CBS 121591]|uniref:Uncharacterized protein n=1 Tax=Aspergillus uvarum CBS 121591 TaxID=1448315 RepID=A0A319BZB7_9EURO|nr:hypothetical protein BO82DRAFT_357699 [Aspergillus uvarum CBS 121591]PYH78105.1 hypothetical protein BO82DRAFT_357699 [Aspergillus uvarum CBS 121591]
MSHSADSIHPLDPDHNSCIGGQTVKTCRSCAGNAPRGSICNSCSGHGFVLYVCTHCNPAAAVSMSTPGSSTPASPASLSRSSSTSVSSQNDARQIQSWRRFGDGDEGPPGGRIETKANTPRGL